ncbi:MAG TPA: PEP-CTERM sorting domain-containing protein [Bryobacteraceae bacterium]|nr:PEP-CTERM sorting domain-containing protein [Bryobacteraceae bacterium]
MRSSVFFRVATILVGAATPVFAGVRAVTPEPSLMALTAVGVGAIVIIARKRRNK